jgi:hypothetical protein
MAQKLQSQLRERSGLFQYADLSDLSVNDNPPIDHEDNTQVSRPQPEEEPIRRISMDLQETEERLREAQETPVPESPIPTPSVGPSMEGEDQASDTVSAETDQSETITDPDMEPVYNAILQEKLLPK